MRDKQRLIYIIKARSCAGICSSLSADPSLWPSSCILYMKGYCTELSKGAIPSFGFGVIHYNKYKEAIEYWISTYGEDSLFDELL